MTDEEAPPLSEAVVRRLTTPDGVELELLLQTPVDRAQDTPGVVLLHGFPSGAIPAARIGADLGELAQRLADIGWFVIVPRLRGCGTSGGDFSLASWLADAAVARSALDDLVDPDLAVLVGFGTGAAAALHLAADDPSVGAVATLGCPADFSDWAAHPARLLQHARESGVISTPGFPADEAAWRSELKLVSSDRSAARIAPRPLLVIHGTEDERVPQVDARLIADAHGRADLRILDGADHGLRHDPRAVALLVGWLERRRSHRG